MLAVVGDLVRNLVVIIFLNALLEMLLPGGEYRRYIRLVTGLIVVLMVVGTIGALLGKAPRLEPVMGEQEPPAVFGDSSGQAEDVEAIYRQQVLRQCRERVTKLMEDEIAATGKWELAEAAIVLDEESESENFGAPEQVELRVRAASAEGRPVKPVNISPVKMEGAGKEGSREAAAPAEPVRLKALEQSLASLLGLDPGRVTVHVDR